MRRLLIILGLCVAFASLAADSGKVAKVLPFLLDQQGRIAKSPSLFDRDAYQAYLREHTNEIAGVRYDVLCKPDQTAGAPLKVRVELRGVLDGTTNRIKTLEADIAPGRFGSWSEMKFDGDDYKKFGPVVAWRASLWNNTGMVGEQQSFLW